MSTAEPAEGDVACDHPSVQAEKPGQSDEAGSQPVGAVMVTKPKSLPLHASAGAARGLFTNPKVLSAVLLEGSDFAGLLDREAIPAEVGDAAPLAPYAQQDVPTITPDRPVSEAAELMHAHGALRLAVVAADGRTLAGLLCLDHERKGFCQG